MNASIPAPSWLPHPPAPWSMPISLQPRAVRQCRLLHADGRRPVRRSRLGYHIRPRGSYQLEFAAASEEDLPCSVSVVAGPMVRVGAGESPSMAGEGACRRFTLSVARSEESPRLRRCCFSALERLTLKLEYGEGREDLEQALWLVLTPRRTWGPAALGLAAALGLIVPWLSPRILARGDVPEAWSRVLSALSHPGAWVGLLAAVLAVWLATAAGDRVQLRVRRGRLQREVRREVQQYLQRAQERYRNVNSNVPM